ncbi:MULTISPECIES: hypothetical protein [unclassified Stenotrophomonas]|uniref:hypothetical protein n=1 Tax=unclassified Stenotrophomonas TaxID=196198 RepID=UPI0017842324|nr:MULTISPECIES: hypothetical protein [unclassified Stenotrophomonas]MBD8636631.1 hypothetical protein [Stenotrophomonas sp. CFBP 13725]MBD8696815.1 hypothetical protein [Stenotrophomonas sp. CFBP 13718]
MSNQVTYEELIKLLNEIDPFYKSGNSIPAERAFIPIAVWERFRALIGRIQLEEHTQHVSSEERPIDAIKFPGKPDISSANQRAEGGYSDGWNDALTEIRNINTRRL